jgi:hypothetical protein
LPTGRKARPVIAATSTTDCSARTPSGTNNKVETESCLRTSPGQTSVPFHAFLTGACWKTLMALERHSGILYSPVQTIQAEPMMCSASCTCCAGHVCSCHSVVLGEQYVDSITQSPVCKCCSEPPLLNITTCTNHKVKNAFGPAYGCGRGPVQRPSRTACWRSHPRTAA